jgi:hypothetical protein
VMNKISNVLNLSKDRGVAFELLRYPNLNVEQLIYPNDRYLMRHNLIGLVWLFLRFGKSLVDFSSLWEISSRERIELIFSPFNSC